ncbi:MAG: FAD-dependent oxidoreductase [Pseudomonadota bacterium]
MPDCIVIGGGAVGLSCAVYLQEAGLAVTVIEPGDPGAQTSWGNCGLIEPSHADPQTQPAALLTALTTAWRRDAPLRIPFPANARRASWLARFAAHCTTRHRNHARAARFALLVHSRNAVESLFAGDDNGSAYVRRGMLTLYRSRKGFETHRRVHDHLAGPWLGYGTFEGDDLESLDFPVTPGVAAAILTDCDGHLDPVRLGPTLADRFEAAGGTLVRTRALGIVREAGRASGVSTDAGTYRARSVVLAAGPWSDALARSAGIRLPIEPAKGLSITWRKPLPAHRHPIYFYDRKVVLTPWADGYRLGSMLEFAGFDESIPEHRLRPLLEAPGEYLEEPPSESLESGERWVGFRPMTYDELPIIGPSTVVPGLFLACGHGQLGISMSAGSGRLIADAITGAAPTIDPSPYLPARFGV